MKKIISVSVGMSLIASSFAWAQGILLDEITISANMTQSQVGNVGSSISVFTEENLANSSETYLVDFLDDVTGITSTQNGPRGTTASFFIRGLASKYVKVIVDGIEVGDVTQPQVSSSISGLQLSNIERIEVLKGSQSSLYGGSAVGGVISVFTKKPTKSGSKLKFETGRYGTSDLSYSFTTSGDKSSTNVNAHYYQTDGFSAQSSGSEADGYESSQLGIKTDYYLSDTTTFFMSADIQDQKGDQDDWNGDDLDDTYKISTQGLNTGLEFLTPKTSNRLSLNYYDIDRFYDEETDSSYEGSRIGLAFESDMRLSRDSLSYALSYHTDSSMITATKKRESSQLHLFGEYLFKGVNGLSLGINGRLTDHSKFGSHTTGRVSALYSLDNGIKFTANYGTGFRAPSLYELFEETWGYGNENLKPETSRSNDVGLEIPFNSGQTVFSITSFDSKVTNEIQWSGGGYINSSSGEIRRSGYESSLTHKLGDSAGLAINYTLTDDGSGGLVRRVPKNDYSLSLNYDVGSNIGTAIKLRRVENLTDNADLTTLQPNYTLLSAKVNYKLTDDLSLYLRGENLLDETYEVLAGYGTAGRSFYAGISLDF